MAKISMIPEVRDLAYVPRWGIVRTIKTQSVAEHSYFVALLVNDLIEWVNSNAPRWNISTHTRSAMLLYALHHDVSEGTTGDITGPIKNKIVDKKAYDEFIIEKERRLVGWSPTADAKDSFTPHELFVLKFADMMEALLFVIDEQKMGNQLWELSVSLEQVLCTMINNAMDEIGTDFAETVEKYMTQTLAKNRFHSYVNQYDVTVKP